MDCLQKCYLFVLLFVYLFFLIIIDKIYAKNTCEYGAFIFIMDCIKHIFEIIVSKNRQYFLIICAESNIIFYGKETWSFLKG